MHTGPYHPTPHTPPTLAHHLCSQVRLMLLLLGAFLPSSSSLLSSPGARTEPPPAAAAAAASCSYSRRMSEGDGLSSPAPLRGSAAAREERDSAWLLLPEPVRQWQR